MNPVDPHQYDVIVLGVGGMGSAACYHLAKAGARVLGLEQFAIGHDRGSSHGETRIIRRAYFEHADYVPLLNRAYELWSELERISLQPLFVRNGVLVYGDPATSIVYKGTVESARKHGIKVEELAAADATQRFPTYRVPKGLAAVLEPDAGYLNVERSVLAHAEQAKQLGVTFRQRERVLSYRTSSNGVEVHTEMGTYHAREIVIAGGAWSDKLMSELKLPLKVYRVLQYWFEAHRAQDLKHEPPCFAFHLEGDFFYGFPTLDGRTVKVASHFSRTLIEDPSQKDQILEAPQAELEALSAFIERVLPEVSTRLDRFVSCLYTMTPDEHFIIDRHPERPHVTFAAGFSGHGFKFSSVVGEILAELSLQGKTRHPIDFLRLR